MLWAACLFPQIDFLPEDDGAGATGGAGGVTGTGGADNCALGEVTGCADGEKCSVVDMATGDTGCVTAGNKPAWARCEFDADCQAGQWCDGSTEVCHPICQPGNDECNEGPGSKCIAAFGDSDTAIPNLGICTSDCDPLTADPCSDDPVALTTCYYNIDETYWDCAKTLGLKEGEICTPGPFACERGTGCVGSEMSVEAHCLAWCTPPDSPTCDDGENCNGVNFTITHGSDEIGICAPP